MGVWEACKIKAEWSELAQSKSIYFGAVGGILAKITKSGRLVARNESFQNTCKHWAFNRSLKQKKRGSISFLFFIWWALLQLTSLSLRRNCAHQLMLTGVLPLTFRLFSNLLLASSSYNSPIKNPTTRVGFFIGGA